MDVGDEIDGWQLLGVLGQGGNAKVWRAEHEEYGVCALKVLDAKRPATERYRRFAREVEEMRRLEGRDGVLPLVAATVPEEGGSAWLAMPVATGLEAALAGQPLEVVIERLAQVAETLASLADEGRHHRDIKPSNLYASGDRALVGDFGLIEVPGTDSITDVTGINGPRHYVPWEVVANEPGYDVERADTYSLAKTIWVLATRQGFPLPGPQDPSDRASAISSYTPHPLASDLDQIIAACTRNDPQLRPAVRDVAADLRALLEPRDAQAELEEDPSVMQRFAALMRPTFTAADRRSALKAELDSVIAAAAAVLEPVLQRISTLQPQRNLWVPEILLLGWSTRTEEFGSPEVVSTGAVGFVAPGRDEIEDWTLTGGFAAEVLGSGVIRMYVAYATHVNGLQFERLFSDGAEVPSSSVRTTQVAKGLANQLVANFAGAVERWTELMDGGED